MWWENSNHDLFSRFFLSLNWQWVRSRPQDSKRLSSTSRFPQKEFVGPCQRSCCGVGEVSNECPPYPEVPKMNVEKNGKATRYCRKKKTMFDMCTSIMRNKHIYSHVYIKIYLFPWEDVLIERCWKISSQAKLFGRAQDPLGVFFGMRVGGFF